MDAALKELYALCYVWKALIILPGADWAADADTVRRHRCEVVTPRVKLLQR